MARRRNRSRDVRSDAPDPASPSPVVSHDVIARRAHEFFVQRGGTHGHDLEDWLAAERELREGSAGKARL